MLTDLVHGSVFQIYYFCRISPIYLNQSSQKHTINTRHGLQIEQSFNRQSMGTKGDCTRRDERGRILAERRRTQEPPIQPSANQIRSLILASLLLNSARTTFSQFLFVSFITINSILINKNLLGFLQFIKNSLKLMNRGSLYDAGLTD